MRTVDVVTQAVAGTFRAKLRTSLTVLAISIGAFTLSLTNGVGTGINAYIDDTVASIGADDVLTVTRTVEASAPTDGPQEYDPDAAAQDPGAGGDPFAEQADPLTEDDLATIGDVEGVERVEPARSVGVDYVQHDDGTRYELALSPIVAGMQVELEAGDQVDLEGSEPQVVLPESYVDPLGFGSAEDAVGATVTLAVTDAEGTQSTLDATVVGVAAPGLVSLTGAVPNDALTLALADLQQVGVPDDQEPTYASASVWFDATAGEEHQAAVVEALDDAGYTATTLEDQLGTFTSVIDTIVLVLNGFAIIALVAAGIGIINTLFMSVQERTREIGLMKAMGLASGRVFALFSLEAVTIGLVGSAVGVLAAMGAAQLISTALASTLLADLPGLTLVAFDPVSVAAVVVGVMAIAFLAGTLPALRAARQDPIESLRYE